MTETRQTISNWHNVTSADEARDPIDSGIPVTWQEIDTIRMRLDASAEIEVIRHFARRFVEFAGCRLQAKIITESVVVWLTGSCRDNLLHAFVEEFFSRPGCDDACWIIVELALGAQPDDSTKAEDRFETVVAMICELCLSVQEYDRAYQGEFKEADAFLDYAAKALLSIGDSQSMNTRLSLIHYFGVYEHGHAHHTFLNRFMVRFGRSVLDHLFTLLLREDCDVSAKQYLIENLPYLLETDAENQKIVADTFETFLPKNPNRISQFLLAFAEAMKGLDDPRFDKSARVFILHVHIMLRAISGDGNLKLARDLIGTILKFHRWTFFAEALESIRNDEEIPLHFVLFMELGLIEMDKSSEPEYGNVVPLRLFKRRRPLLKSRVS